VRTVAATLAHGCPRGGATEVDVRVDAGPGARLAWLPEGLIAHAGCRHRSTAYVALAAGAVAVWQETVALGRHGEKSGDVELHLDVETDGRPLLRDALRAGPSAPAADGPAVLGSARHVGALALLGAPATTAGAAYMPLAGPGALARAVAVDGAALERLLGPTRRLFLDHLDDDTEDRSHVA
jgi:urease accessory protein